jgi:2-dehydropantoate 2-reductase
VLTRATLDILATDPGTRALRRINGAARVGAHRTSMLQDLERGRPLELDAMLTSVQELGRVVELDTPHIDAVLALTQQLGRTMGLYPTFPRR